MGRPEFEEPQTFVYPSIYVSTSGMITVLLKSDVSVEMTIDRTLRLVNHHLNMAVATNSRGTASVLHTRSVKVSQNNTTTDAEVNAVKAKMTTECILFGSGTNCYKFDYNYIEPALPRFTDMSTDKSVNLLFASESYGSTLIQQCLHLAGTAEYENLPKGGVIIRINGIKITQTGRGDVTVVSGPKFMKISPSVGYVRLNTHFTEMAVDKDGVLRMRRGDHTINSCNDRVILSNGKIEAGLDNEGQ
ncbi:uncharacterized protein LOC126832694 [Patella vulgata]|uniref:uncharacterized protein LOC126832694 n=1 Tax=Patella vulgata TaxID=6465 RepID=UPI00217FA74A|nr:uncharacterized protein LOC126832694 [Patella vulgata]